MPPLKFCLVWTVWKYQGQMIKCKVVSDFGWSEKKDGLTHTAFYRATIFCDFEIFN